MKTLEELKAENAALEAEELASPQEVEEETEDEAVDVESEETEEVAEPAEEDASETKTEDWMQSDDQTSQDNEVIPNAAWKGARKVFDGKVAKIKEAHNGELEKLNARISDLEGGRPQALNKPKRDDFMDADDPDEAFTDALTDWKLNDYQARADAKRINDTYVQETQIAVDDHYKRAAVLSKKSKISAEQYQAADLRVREAVDAIIPGGGNSITEQLIADLGEGSEKVFYNLGVNNARLTKFTDLLKASPRGIKAAMFLTQLKTELGAVTQRTTRAPKPAQQVNGDAGPVKFRSAKKIYDAAHKKGDYQKALDVKLAAKKEGANTSNW